MLQNLSLSCARCDGDLDPGDRKLSMRTPEGLRHAYECSCGGITITIEGESSSVAREV